jgi:flavin reductase (DIM6/NTAB) family NADH-FMN oxidoreductase RutF
LKPFPIREEIMKKQIKPTESLQMLDHGPTVLICVKKGGGTGLNLFAVSWIIPCSKEPTLVLIPVNPKNFSHDLMKQAGEFTVNIPGLPLLDKLHFCGTASGRRVDKVKELGLKLVPGQVLDTPLIEECIGHMECKVVDAPIVGDHTVIVGEVAAASAEDTFFDGSWQFEDDNARTLHYLGGKRYAVIGEVREAVPPKMGPQLA